MISISLCMIVKDEQKNLRRCLDSLHGLMDEIIIVDTGSTDQTKEIANEYTDKVFDYKWEDDFSKARNYCISKATKDYIYIADADEVLDEENHHRFLQLKQVLLPEIDIVQMKYGNQLEHNTVYNYDEEYRPKLFKRIRKFEFIDPVHETLRIEPVIYDSEVVITHKPHENHASRDFETFQKAIKRGERLGSRILNMYAKELFIAGNESDFLQAEEYFTKVFQEGGRNSEEVLNTICVLSHCARLRQDTIQFFKYAMKAMVTTPCSEICYEIGEFYFEREDYEEAVLWYYNAVHESEASLSLKYQGKMVYIRLAECYAKLGQESLEQQYKELANTVASA
ncbi:MAG: glycosyltransferase family 2 protein [bacterium]|nr:glycosyltransferase family 2 protein [bacterium]